MKWCDQLDRMSVKKTAIAVMFKGEEDSLSEKVLENKKEDIDSQVFKKEISSIWFTIE